MRPAVHFINCLGRAFDTMGLAAEGHSSIVSAMEAAAYDSLCLLLEREDEPVFWFMDGDVFFAYQPVQPLSDWKWTHDLTRAGVERIEISQGVTRAEFAGFVEVLFTRLSRALNGATTKAVPTSEEELPHIRFGQMDTGERGWSGTEKSDSPLWHEELEATEWLLGQAARGERISHGLAWTTTQSMHAALRDEKSVLRLLVPLKQDDRYTATHSLNAALLAMALGNELGLSEADVTAIGEAAILHDVGQARVPEDIVRKPGKLSPAEWEVVKRHPAEGARMLLDSGPGMDLPARVAYEHHIGYDGNGYPAHHYTSRIHPATQVLQVCDVYDALRTRRPFRDPWSAEKIKSHLRAESGRSLYPGAVEGLERILELAANDDPGGTYAMGQ